MVEIAPVFCTFIVSATVRNMTGLWYTFLSEKYESQLGSLLFPVPNHQPDI